MEGETAEEDAEHENPFEVLEEGCEEAFLFGTVADEREREVAEEVEDDDD